MNNFIAERNATLKKFCNIAGRENAAKWALKKYLESIDTLLENNDYNCKLVTDIRNAIARKANVKRQYVNMPKWERLVNRAKRELKKPLPISDDGALGDFEFPIYTHTPKKGETIFEIKVRGYEPEYHSPHVHIKCNGEEATILMSNPTVIKKGSLPKGILKMAIPVIMRNFDTIIEKYYEFNPQHKKEEQEKLSPKKQTKLKKK